MIKPGILRIDPDKVQVVEEWPTLEKLKDVRGFLGFTNFHRSLIKGYGEIARPLTNLTRKEEGFKQDTAQKEAFRRLKEVITEEPVVVPANPKALFEIKADILKDGAGAAFIQRDKKGRLHLVAFLSYKFIDTERRYLIYDKELMAIILAYR